jgi:hypothetical protein
LYLCKPSFARCPNHEQSIPSQKIMWTPIFCAALAARPCPWQV